VFLEKYTREFPTNLKMAYPIMLGQIGHVLVGLVDNIMVGKLGASALAAVSLGNGLFFIAMSIAIGFSFAITPLTAEADGQESIEKAKAFFKNGILICTIIGILLFVLIKLSQPFLVLLNQPEEVLIIANPYIDIIAYSLVPFAIYQAIKQFSDGMSATKYAMYATVIANLINVLLNYLLIYGKWGFPKMEVEGAALGTLISRFVMLAFLVVSLKNSKKFKVYFVSFFKDIYNRIAISRLLKLGFPSALQMLFEFGIFTSSVFLSGVLSTESQAANQIVLNLASMTFMVVVGLGVTSTVRVGNQVGKNNYIELERIMRSIFLLVFIIQCFFALIFVLFKDYLPLFYIDDVKVVAIASQLLLMVALFQLSDGFQVTILGALRGMQDVNVPTLLLFIAYWCIGFPVAYFLGKENWLGAFGIWVGLFVGLSVSSFLLFIRYRYLISEKNK